LQCWFKEFGWNGQGRQKENIAKKLYFLKHLLKTSKLPEAERKQKVYADDSYIHEEIITSYGIQTTNNFITEKEKHQKVPQMHLPDNPKS
jgi:hypothetical protein